MDFKGTKPTKQKGQNLQESKRQPCSLFSSNQIAMESVSFLNNKVLSSDSYKESHTEQKISFKKNSLYRCF